jgi:zinc transport system ATP-binding protein
MSPILSLKDLTVAIDKKLIIDQVSFEIMPGQIIGLVGPNGGGKSTLVKAILGLQPITSGTITRSRDLRIGYLPQRPPISFDIPLTVKELWHIYQANTAKAKDLINRLNLTNLADKQVRSLSGGELQKVFLIVALADNPNLIILDEPGSNIDTDSDQTLQALLLEEKKADKSMIVISHDIDSIAQIADNLLCLQQRMICTGKPNLVLRSQEFQDLIGDHHHHHH